MFGVSEPDRSRRLRAYRDRPVGPGPGREDAGGADRVGVGAERRRRRRVRRAGPPALADDTHGRRRQRLPDGPGHRACWSLADLDEAPRALGPARSHQSAGAGSLFAVSCVHLWNGITQIRRGELAECEALLRTGRGELQLWGGLPVDGAYFTSSISLVRLERGRRGGRAARARRAPVAAVRGLRRRATCGCAARSRSCSRRATPRRRWSARRSTAPRSAGCVNPAWVPWRSLQALALRPARARATRRSPRAEEELEHARAWGAPGTVGRSAAGPRARCAAARTAWPTGRGGRRVLEARPRGSSWPRRWPRSGRGAAPRAQAHRRARAAAPGARAGRACAAPRRWPPRCAPSCTPPAAGRAPTAMSGRRGAHRQRARVAAMARRGADQPRHRPDAVRHAQDGRGAPQRGLPQARHRLAARDRRSLEPA